MRNIAQELSKTIKRSVGAELDQQTNQYLTWDGVVDVKISGYRSMHAHQVYKRKRITENLARSGSPPTGNNVSP